ncbi:DNA-binding NarL/FixJ family response regulator [Actinomadura coerulea]|uniref:DNA-binding NarL/FixJ family response regulator n=1 Tax=Actinomadura coerulea TaxID=46159 RepID=A0A7X0L1R8_9ACTN|nr:CHAT domain-containing protein [Actinomadura coerulea]MBB6398868.1 DNA-binding NarL/FixJ family response regulator [Actinomadura coerulea]
MPEERGDGLLIFVPPEFSRDVVLVKTLLDLLPAKLAAYNETAVPGTEVLPRAAVHVGAVQGDEYGLADEAVRHVVRLLQAPALKVPSALGNELALVVSDAFYRAELAEWAERFPEADVFWPIQVDIKETSARAWLYRPSPTEGAGGTADQITVLVVDERPAVRTNIARRVATSDFTLLVGMENGIKQALTAAKQLSPDVILVGASLLHTVGVLAMRRLTSAYRVVLLTGGVDPDLLRTALLSSVRGSVREDAFTSEALARAMRTQDGWHQEVDTGSGGAKKLGAVIEDVLSGGAKAPSFRDEVPQFLLEGITRPWGRVELTRRESEIFKLMLKGRTDVEIAKALSVSTRTVRNHVGRTLDKLQDDAHLQPPMASVGNDAGPRQLPEDADGLPALVPPRISCPASRILSAGCPSRVQVGQDLHIIVRIVADMPRIRHAVELRPFPIPVGGAKVQIVLQPDEGLLPLMQCQYVIHVPAQGDSDPIAVPFEVIRPGLRRVEVMAWVGGTFVGELVVEISAEPAPVSGRHVERTAALSDLRPVNGEVTLHVSRRNDEQYSFQLLSDHTIYEPFVESVVGDPRDAIERTFAALQNLASSTGGSAKELKLREAGTNLWNQMVPQVVKEQFWELNSKISSFSIATDNDIIPWELMRPIRPGDDGKFLVERFPVARRVYGQERAVGISLEPTAFVIPDPMLTDVPGEIEELDRLFRTVGGGTPGRIFQDVVKLVEWITTGEAGLLHFACHNYFKQGEGGSSIIMRDDTFEPTMLSSAVGIRSLSTRTPLVFLNACRSAGATFEYTQLMSWAVQFMKAGAGAFIGTLWEVPSKQARHFAEAFYDACLKQRLSLGDATNTARNAIKNPGDPTWLAYTVYGNPFAMVG